VQIYVQKAHLKSLLRQPHGQVAGNAAFAHSTLAAHYNDFIFDAREFAAYEFLSGFFLRPALAGRAGFLFAVHLKSLLFIFIRSIVSKAVTLKVIFHEVNSVVRVPENRPGLDD
jgi:hypothetical protein